MTFKNTIENAKRLVEAYEEYGKIKKTPSRYDWVRQQLPWTSHMFHPSIFHAVIKAREFLEDVDKRKQEAQQLVHAWDSYPYADLKSLSKTEWIRSRVEGFDNVSPHRIGWLVKKSREIIDQYTGSIFDVEDSDGE